MKPRVQAPRHLKPETRAWYRTIAERYVLESHHQRILQLAAEAWDRRTEARAILDTEGLTATNKFGEKKPHPCVSIERDCRAAFLRAIRELGLDLAEEPARPGVIQPMQPRKVSNA